MQPSENLRRKFICIHAYLPDDFTMSALQTLNSDVMKAMIGAGASDVRFEFNYPGPDKAPAGKQKGEDNGTEERDEPVGRGGRGDDADAGEEKPARRRRRAADAEDAGDEDGKPVRKRRGRPARGSTEEAGPEARSSRRRAEGPDGDEPDGADEADDEADGEGEGRRRGNRADRRGVRGNSAARRLTDEADEDSDEDGDEDAGWSDDEDAENGEEWNAKTPGDAWPDALTPKVIDGNTIKKLLAEHHEATGAEGRTLTFDIIEDVCGTRKLGEVERADFKKLAKALLKDTARYKYGIKKRQKA